MNKSSKRTSDTPQQVKPKTGILHKTKAIDYSVYYNGLDVTPKPLGQHLFKVVKERQLNVVNMTDQGSKIESASQFSRMASAGRFKTEIHTQSCNKSMIGMSMDENYILQSIITETITDSDRLREDSFISQEDKPPEIIPPIPDNVSLILAETDTFFILDLPSSSEIKGTFQGDLVEQLNNDYEYLTVGKGKNRKVIDAMVQTHSVLLKSRETEAVKYKKATHSTYASNWEMYDSLTTPETKTEKESGEVMEEVGPTSKEKLHCLNESASIDSFRMSLEDKQLYNLIANERFLQAVAVIERLLANNTYNNQQKRFKDSTVRENTEYKYDMDLLWTFANDQTKGRAVTAVNWNPSNEDIIVVGYGKFYFHDKTSGMVLIWNIKNPVQPERSYFFEESVSYVVFSKIRPNLVAVGFTNGSIQVIDIRERDLAVVHKSGSGPNMSFERVNYLAFYSGDEHYNFEEQILACFNDGRICKYRFHMMLAMPCIQIMRAPEADGKIKGISKMTVCGIPAIPLTKYTGALRITFHPADPSIYYLCTNTGVIHKCSTNYFNQHLDLLLAHDGPTYNMQFSPFCNKLYATCGSDWYIRIWAEGIHEPLLELFTVMHPILTVLWSPTHSTILVAIQGSQIQIWDLHRKVHCPQNIFKSPTNSRNTAMRFTSNGRCLTIGDIDGNTHIYSLENLPIPPFFQDSLLYSAIKKNLITRPELLRKFEALKSMNFEKIAK